MKRSIVMVVVVMAAIALATAGCATKSYVNDQVTQSSKAADAKVGEVQKCGRGEPDGGGRPQEVGRRAERAVGHVPRLLATR
jgi:hypothetical protein